MWTFVDSNANGAYNEAERGIPAKVALLQAGTVITEAVTLAPLGRLTFEVPPGFYTVRLIVPEGYAPTTPTEVTAQVGAEPAVAAFGLRAEGGSREPQLAPKEPSSGLGSIERTLPRGLPRQHSKREP